MPKFCVQAQIDIIMAAFALHNYTRHSFKEDMIFNFVAEHPDCIPIDELRVVCGSDTSKEKVYEGSNNIKLVRNDIATLIQNAQHR